MLTTQPRLLAAWQAAASWVLEVAASGWCNLFFNERLYLCVDLQSS